MKTHDTPTNPALLFIKVLVCVLTLQALTTSARSAVSMKDASFLSEWKDLTITSPDGPIALTRYYSSRSHHLGWFGFGWCTDFEKKIEFLKKDRIRLSDCKMSLPDELAQSEYIRTKTYIQINRDVETLKFDLEGKLMSISTPLIKAQLTYSSQGLIAKIHGLRRLHNGLPPVAVVRKLATDGGIVPAAPQEPALVFTTDAQTRLVKAVTSSDGAKTTYEYEGDKLVAVKDSRSLSNNYHYDEYQNLMRVDYGDRTFELITYDGANDRVKQLRDRKGCVERFNYNDNRTSDVQRICKGQVVAHATYYYGNREKPVDTPLIVRTNTSVRVPAQKQQLSQGELE